MTSTYILRKSMIIYSYILGPVTSVLVNKYGCRCTVMVGAVVYFIGFIASSTTSTFHLLYLFFGVISGEKGLPSLGKPFVNIKGESMVVKRIVHVCYNKF